MSTPVEKLLLQEIPGAKKVILTNEQEDRSGKDYNVECDGGCAVGVDVKIRFQDFLLQPKDGNPQDDLAIETWSCVPNEDFLSGIKSLAPNKKDIETFLIFADNYKIGWSRNWTKHTDYILWWWVPTQRWLLFPFRMLCAITNDKWPEWIMQYKVRAQHTLTYNNDWYSECVFVPRVEIWRQAYQRFGGERVV